MKSKIFPLLLGISISATTAFGQNKQELVYPNENLIAENIPEIPKELATKVRKYTESRGASLSDVHPVSGELIIATRFGQTPQLHQVQKPLGDRTQITFFEEPVTNASFEPVSGKYLIYSADANGNEFSQLYRLDLKTLQSSMLTAGGRTQNGGVTWRKDGQGFYYSSTKRNGKDRDIYFMDPQFPEKEKQILEVQGGGWGISDINADQNRLLIRESLSANESYLWLLDLNSRKLSELTDRKTTGVIHENGTFSDNPNEFWLITDKENEFKRLATFNQLTKSYSYHTSAINWNVENFVLSKDNQKLIFVTNENGSNKMYIMATKSKSYAEVKNLPVGLISSLRFSPDEKSLFFTQSTSKTASDVFQLILKTGEIIRWTKSELGQIREEDIALPKSIAWKSFDGLEITGFYYPAAAKFTGKRPVLISIHGGPEGQSMASFLGANNYYTNEMGVAIIAPNVRGSSGYGKSFLAKDNGFLREDSVKDIGALLDWIEQQPELDSERIMIMGGSYGGYMSLATAFHYADRIRCSVDIVGISNFNTFLKNTEDYRRDLRRVEYGDERIPEMSAFMEKIAPLNNVEKIKKPIFIIQGKNDPRVPVTEATQMRDKLKQKGNTVWYLEGKDEGHGFKKKANIDFQRLAVIRFMEEYLLR